MNEASNAPGQAAASTMPNELALGPAFRSKHGTDGRPRPHEGVPPRAKQPIELGPAEPVLEHQGVHRPRERPPGESRRRIGEDRERIPLRERG